MAVGVEEGMVEVVFVTEGLMREPIHLSIIIDPPTCTPWSVRK
jgi:hypothetical protein